MSFNGGRLEAGTPLQYRASQHLIANTHKMAPELRKRTKCTFSPRLMNPDPIFAFLTPLTAQTVVEKPAVVKKTKATPKRQGSIASPRMKSSNVHWNGADCVPPTAAEDASPVSAKKQKTVKVTKEVTEVKTTTPAEEPKPRAAKASKKKAAKAPEPEPETMEVDEEEVAQEDEADESVVPVAEASDSEDGDDDEIDES